MTNASAAPQSAISVENLSKRYGRTLALDGISVDVPPNSMFALLGPNGAGKTTLIHILCTILRPDGGVAKVGGYDVVRQPLKARQNIGVVFQEPSLDDRLTAQENLNFHGLAYRVPMAERRKRIPEVLALVDLTDWRNALVRTFSAGMKRRLEIARALLHNPRILFLDEPTVGLDAQSRQRIWEYLSGLRKERDLTVVVTTHYIEEVESCDKVCIVDHGKILADGTPEQLKMLHGSALVRAVPRDGEARAAMRVAYPDATDGPGGGLVIPAEGERFTEQFLAQFGHRIQQVAFDNPTLESVFLSLTGRDLRDKPANERERTLSFAKRGGELTR